jgi:hypothetical protein
MSKSKVLMIFIDGIGIGKKDPAVNPFFRYNFKIFSQLFTQPPDLQNQYQSVNGAFYWPVDACMGIEGLPQSGTGQTSIFCGVNAQEIIGKHFGPFPYSTLIPLIKEKNICLNLKDRGLNVNFVNAYPKIFFDYLKSGKQRLSFTTLTCRLNGMKLHNSTDLRNGKALSAEIANSRWINRLNYKLPLLKPETVAKRLMKIAGQNNFTLFEYFLTDHFGHFRHPDYMDYAIKVLDDFLYKLFVDMPEDLTLFICSDHGNFEDMSVKSHTLNPALCMSTGIHAEYLAKNIKSLDEIKPALMEMLI